MRVVGSIVTQLIGLDAFNEGRVPGSVLVIPRDERRSIRSLNLDVDPNALAKVSRPEGK